MFVPSSKAVLFASTGTATREIELPESGKYGIGILARGTPCEGVYPIAEFSVDGKPFGVVQLVDGQWQTLGTVGHVEKGKHTLTVAFVNDASAPPKEDRNLEVDKLFVARDRRADDVTFLTVPSAVAVVPRGAGQVVFDFLRWDTEQQNARQAARYACSMLTALDADFLPRPAVTIQCDQMTPATRYEVLRQPRAASPPWAATGTSRRPSRWPRRAATPWNSLPPATPPTAFAHWSRSTWVTESSARSNSQQKAGEPTLWRSISRPASTNSVLRFVNDHSSPTGDRNLRLDKLVF